MQYQGFADGVKTVLDIVHGVHHGIRFSTHSLRRGGCQFFYRLGVDIDSIRIWGRWKSDAVWLYLMDLPAESARGTVSWLNFQFDGAISRFLPHFTKPNTSSFQFFKFHNKIR